MKDQLELGSAWIVVALCLLMLTGCAQNSRLLQSTGAPFYYKPNLDRPWDPQYPASLTDQWVSPQGAALIRCCGSKTHCETWQSPRC